MKACRLTTSVVAFFCCGVVVHGASVRYSIQDLGISYAASSSGDLSNLGVAVVSSFLPYQGFVYENGTASELDAPLGATVIAALTNDSGQFVANTRFDHAPIRSLMFYENRFASPDVWPTGASAYAFAMNNLGQVVGREGAGPNYQPALFTPQGTELLGTFGGPRGTAADINNYGAIVGHADHTPSIGGPVSEAFVYEDGVMRGLGHFNQGRNSVARAINDIGDVVGTADGADGQYLAFISLMTGSGRTPLLRLGVDSEPSVAVDINQGRVVIGQAGPLDGSPGDYAWVLDLRRESYYVPLIDVIPSDSGWDRLISADKINDSGQILGVGLRGDELRAYLATPISESSGVPEPPGVACALVLLAAIATNRKTRTR